MVSLLDLWTGKAYQQVKVDSAFVVNVAAARRQGLCWTGSVLSWRVPQPPASQPDGLMNKAAHPALYTTVCVRLQLYETRPNVPDILLQSAKSHCDKRYACLTIFVLRIMHVQLVRSNSIYALTLLHVFAY